MRNEFIEKAKECKSAEELLALAKDNGIEMTAEAAAEMLTSLDGKEYSDDELENVAGGEITQCEDGWWAIFDPEEKAVVAMYRSKAMAMKKARQMGLSSEVCTMTEIKDRMYRSMM